MEAVPPLIFSAKHVLRGWVDANVVLDLSLQREPWLSQARPFWWTRLGAGGVGRRDDRAPPRGRVRPKTQNGRPLRRYRRRWKNERLFAWLGNFRRLVVRYERHALNYLGFVHLGCILIVLRQGL